VRSTSFGRNAFHLVPANFYGDALQDLVERYHDTQVVLRTDQHALDADKHSGNDSYSLANGKQGMRLDMAQLNARP
jgi:hypothetical protein